MGRIRVEYCETPPSFSTNPSATTRKLDCYIVEQIESAPYTSARLNLPESGAHTYQVQYGRKLNWSGASNQVTTLRVPAGLFTSVTLQALVSDLPSNAWFALDVGNTGSDSWNGTVGNGGEYTSPNLAAFFNAYWANHGAPTTGILDVPVRVYLDRAGQVLLTNLQVTPTGSKLRAIRLPVRPQGHSSVTASFTVSGVTGPLAVGVDVGGDGSVDWATTGSPAYPATLTTSNLAAAVNAYLAGKPDPTDVPLRFYLAPFATLNLTGFSATPVGQPDASIGAADVTFGRAVAVAVHESATNTRIASADHSRIREVFVDGDPTEGDTVTINATLHNGGGLDTGPLTASFYATPAGGAAWYIGSKFVANVAAAGTETVPLQWNMLGFTGVTPVRVIVDPYNRLAESSETNNEAAANLTIQTRPDLQFTDFQLSDPEPVAGKAVVVTLPVRNNGQTDTEDFAVSLSDAATEVGRATIRLSAATSVAPTFAWTPAAPGPHRLTARSDRDRLVAESNEGNNDKWLDVYVGFGAPVALDSGTPAADPAYTAALGYGAVDTGQPDAVVTCAGRTDPTLRRDPDNRVGYRFDHLQPGRFYHLDVVLYECDNSHRIERVLVDEMLVGGPVDLGDQAEHRLSIRLDPALYRDRAINVAVIGADGSQRAAVVASVTLREIDYRYADSGGANDPGFTPERGWGYLDGVAFPGSLPYRSARVDQTDNEVRYRFDRLDPAKRYQLHLNFWQATGNPLLQRIRADGLDTGTTINLVAGPPISTVIRLSPATYATDGSVIVSVVVLNAGANATVNEIALEEETMLAESPCRVVETPSYSLAFGSLTVNGAPAPAGTVVTAESPRGDVVGCYIVDTAGQYGFMPIYGEDAGASPAIPGMRDGELVTFRVDGALAQATPAFYWHDDRTEHRADLNAAPLAGQAILLQAGWNLLSFRVEPPVGLVESVLNSIAGKYCRVLDEAGIYDCNVPAQFRSLKELHAGKGYYLRIDGGASANLLVEGIQAAPTTPINLHPGWNWVGYLPETTLPIETALASISGAYQRVQSLSQFYDIRYPTFSTLKQMAPGQGYLIYATRAATLTYPAAAAASEDLTGFGKPVRSGEGCNVTPTPDLTLVFGGLSLNGQPAPAGTLVEALTPRGDIVGCFVVDTPGQYGFMPLYGEDASAAPPIPGFREGEAIRLRVNGMAVTAADLTWEGDRSPHQLDLTVDFNHTWLPIIVR